MLRSSNAMRPATRTQPGRFLLEALCPAVALVTGCASPQPSSPAPSSAPSAAGSPGAAASQVAPPRAPAAPRPPPEVLAFAASKGGIHGDHFLLPPDEKGRLRWGVFVGGPRVARALFAVSVEGGVPESQRLANLPQGVAVVAAVARGEQIFVLLRSLALLDQPAGLRGVLVFSSGGGSLPDDAAGGRWLSGAHDEAELRGRLEAMPRQPAAAPGARDAAALQALLPRLFEAISADPRWSGEPVARGGASVVKRWQGALLDHVGLVFRGKPGGEPRRLLLRALAIAARDQGCGADRCVVSGSDGEAYELEFVLDEGEARVRSVTVDEAPPRAALGTPGRRALPVAGGGAATLEALSVLEDGAYRVVAEVPLSDGNTGTIGLAFTEEEGDSPRGKVVVRDGDAWVVRDVWLSKGPGAGDVRFADLDGDGRTDLLLRTTLDLGDKLVARYDTHLAPRSLRDEGSPGIYRSDPAALVAAFDKPSIDAALDAVVKLPARGASRDEVCALFPGPKGRQSLSGVAAPGARFIGYTEPSSVRYSYRATPLASASAARISQLRDACHKLTCSLNRPACWLTDGPSYDVTLLRWQGGELRLGDVVIYEGS
jgi:hypothetical protein